MAIYSDINGFPQSGMPVLKDAKGRAKADSLVVTDAISIVAGDANNLGSVGKNNVFTNGATGSNSFMAGNNNTLNLTGTATEAVVVGTSNTVTLATGQSRSITVGSTNVNIGQDGIAVGNNNGGVGCKIGASNTISGASSNYATLVIGTINTSIGSAAAALGASNIAIGDNATAIGSLCDARGEAAVAMGLYAFARFGYAVAIGIGTDANATNAAIFGHAPNSFSVINSTANSLMLAYEGTNFLLDANRITANKPVKFKNYTVATLPAGQNYDRAMVSDALAPTWGAAVVGGGAVIVPVYYDGAWKVG